MLLLLAYAPTIADRTVWGHFIGGPRDDEVETVLTINGLPRNIAVLDRHGLVNGVYRADGFEFDDLYRMVWTQGRPKGDALG